MRVVLTGGATGGHLVPFLPIIENLRTVATEKNKKLKIYFVGVLDKEAEQLLQKYDIAAINVPSGKIRRYASALNISDLFFRLPFGVLKAMFVMWWLMPDIVLSKGGFGSVPATFAASFYRIPIILHESDAVVGLANKFAAKRATLITTGFQQTATGLENFSNKLQFVGTPVRAVFRQPVTVAQAKTQLGFSADKKLTVITGGSQGAQQINEAVLKILPKLIADTSILHITGNNNFQAISQVSQEILASSQFAADYKAVPFLPDQMHLAMLAADVVVSRSGATTLAELAATKTPALLIPLPDSAQGNQQLNANVFEQAGAARVLDSKNLGESLLLNNIQDLLQNDSLRQQMQAALGTLDTPNAGRQIAEFAFELTLG